MELFNRSPTFGFRLVALVILSIFLMVIDHREHHLDTARNFISYVIAPVQYVVDVPIQLADQIQARIVSHNTLIEDNANLRAHQILLEARLQKLLSLQKENRRLRALLKTSQKHGEKVTVARLLAIDNNPYVHQFTLAKGKRDGVFVGQAVLDAEGVLGQIIRVGEFNSQVLLLTDNRSSIPIENSRTGVRGILVGNGSMEHLALIDVPKTENIEVGDVLVTSGLGNRFPEGYPVGTVRSVIRNPTEHFAMIDVTPTAKFNRSRLVLLVWPRQKHL